MEINGEINYIEIRTWLEGYMAAMFMTDKVSKRQLELMITTLELKMLEIEKSFDDDQPF
jgi:hypothetical protein